jgi:hypothetical protein
MTTKRSWRATPPKKSKPNAPESTQLILKEKADWLINDVMKPEYMKPAPTNDDFNYIADIYSKWYRNYFYFCATYNCPSANAISPSFEAKFARMEYVAANRFNLAYMRHTGQWLEVFQDISMDECLRMIEENPIFMP